MSDWVKEFPAEMMVCDTEGTILEMNNEAEDLFADDGGRGLLNTNVLDCHPEPYRSKFEHMMDKQITNVLFSTANGERRFFFQAPWFQDGQYAGFVEISFPAPDEIPHFVRG